MASSYNFPDYGAFGGNFKGADAFSDKYKDFNYQPSKDSGKFTIEKGISFLNDYLNKSGQNKYQEEAKSRGGFGPRTLGEVDTRGFGGGKLLDNLSIYTPPPSHSPFYIPGQDPPESRNRFAGAAMGAFKGFLAGAATGMPHMAGIGAVAGGLQGGFG